MSACIGLRSGMTVVVTGGAGFIGGALVRRLLDMGCRVAAIDDLSGGKAASLPHHPQLTLHRLCIGAGSAPQVQAIIQTADLVYHLASPIGVNLAHSARFDVVESILGSGTAVIAACRKYRVPLVITSSSEVYGQGLPRPIREADPAALDISPRWGYAAAKLALEHLAAGLYHEQGVPTWLVRPFNIAGPRQRPETGLVVASFTAAAAAGQPLHIHGDGSQVRSFLHVEDGVDALTTIAFNPTLTGRPVNMGSETPTSILELAEMVRRVRGLDVPILKTPLEDVFDGGFTHAQIRIPDITLLKSATGWRPKRSLEEAVRDGFEEIETGIKPTLRAGGIRL